MGALGLSSCNDNFERPPMVFPTSDMTANATVAQLKAQYWSTDRNSVNSIGFLNQITGNSAQAGDSIVIKGRVISESASGNIYNSIVIQGEDCALNISVRTNRLTVVPQFGQEILINVTGQKIGNYNGLMQLGAEGVYNNQPSMTFMESADFEKIFQINGVPRADLVDTVLLTIPDIASKSSEVLERYQSQLVRFDNLTFEEPGQPFAGSQNTNRYAKDANGNRINVRTSAYASFKNDLVPSGTGSVVGILSYYGTDWQLLLNDITGIIGFEGGDKPDTPDTPAQAESSLDATFEGLTKIPDGWTNLRVKGDKDWYARTFDNNTYLCMTGYKGTAPFDCWLITPPIDLKDMASRILTFDTQVNGYGSTKTTFKVFLLSQPDPSKCSPQELKATFPVAPESGYSAWTSSGNIDLSVINTTGPVYIGWQYAATQDANYATWCLDNVKLNAK